MAVLTIDGADKDLIASEFQSDKSATLNAIFNALQAAWTAFTASPASGTGTITTLGTVVSTYRQIGKLLFIRVKVPITTNGTGATYVVFTLPTAAKDANHAFYGVESGVSGKQLVGVMPNTTTVRVRFYDTTYPGVDGAILVVQGFYEVP